MSATQRRSARRRVLTALGTGTGTALTLTLTLTLTVTLTACGQALGSAPDRTAEAGEASGTHVHAVGVNPADGLVYLATHRGLLRYEAGKPRQVGPDVDLMSFVVAGPNHFYASGHPGPGTDLPNPVGLIESTDGGANWTSVSLSGRSDFHALAVSSSGYVGFDGVIRISTDGRTWQSIEAPVQPQALAASPDGATILATSTSGPLRSLDGGRSWTVVKGAPLLAFVDWAGVDTVVGVRPDGSVYVSVDEGVTWRPRGAVPAMPQAVGATIAPDGGLRVDVATAAGLFTSQDGGATFATVPSNAG